MKIALVNPPWSFEGSIYFGCREPHLPVEFGYSKALLERAGHDAILIDAQMDGLTFDEVRRLTAAFGPDMTVTTSAPSYLFWRCAPPELRVPMQIVRALREVGGTLIAVGPHASTTPLATLRKLGVDAVVLGECEEVLVELADSDRDGWREIESIAYAKDRVARVQGGTRAADMAALPALHWPAAAIARHHHHHHRFDAAPSRPGAEMETSRGCPYHCTFCAKDNFRNRFRHRPLEVILRELDALIAQRVEYVYFIDEIFLPNAPLLEALSQREIKFGIQTRVDLWSPQQLELLGKAGCVSVEAGVESISAEGRARLDKNCKISTEELTDRLIHAKRFIAFVQANLIDAGADDGTDIEAWRQRLQQAGVWANQPVPLFPYPGSPDYTRLWGPADDRAWERAVDYYLTGHAHFSDIQESAPVQLVQLEERT